jgi:hypothetical protein
MIRRREWGARQTAVVVVAGLLAAGCGSETPSSQTTNETSAQAAAPHPEQALIEGLVLASRMLARPELGVIGAQGHVSVRSQRDPNHYYIARYVSAGIVSTSDIIENDHLSGRTIHRAVRACGAHRKRWWKGAPTATLPIALATSSAAIG